MFFRRKNFVKLLFSLLVAAFIFPLSAQAQRETFTLDGSLHKTYPLNKGGIFSVENVNGEIRIESWDRDEVDIEIRERNRRGGYEIEIEIDARPNRIEIETRHPRRSRWGRSSSAHYTIKVPREVELYAKSTNGNVSAGDILGEVEAGTTNGRVTLEKITGDVHAHTTNGDIDIEDVKGDVKARTTNESITIRNADGSRIDASTTNGGIRADFAVDPDGRYDFSTTNGSIRVHVPENSQMDVEARCRSRNFHSDFDIMTRFDRDYDRRDWSSRNVRGKVNGGGALVSMSTTNGRIDLRRR